MLSKRNETLGSDLSIHSIALNYMSRYMFYKKVLTKKERKKERGKLRPFINTVLCLLLVLLLCYYRKKTKKRKKITKNFAKYY